MTPEQFNQITAQFAGLSVIVFAQFVLLLYIALHVGRRK